MATKVHSFSFPHNGHIFVLLEQGVTNNFKTSKHLSLLGCYTARNGLPKRHLAGLQDVLTAAPVHYLLVLMFPRLKWTQFKH